MDLLPNSRDQCQAANERCSYSQAIIDAFWIIIVSVVPKLLGLPRYAEWIMVGAVILLMFGVWFFRFRFRK